jgi:hypothetical protein
MAELPHRLVRAASWSLLALGIPACGQPRTAAPEPTVDPCTVASDAPADVRVALAAPVGGDSVTLASTPSERFLATHLLETLVHLDCTGAVQPALATSWSDSAGIVWEFALRNDARMTDGTPLDAGAVLRSWTSAARPAGRLFAGLSAAGPHQLRVELREPARIELFSQPALGVGATATRPVTFGARGWDFVPGDPALLRSADRTLELFSYTADPRNAIEAGVHALVTADPDVIAYGERAGYRPVPLPWSRTYVIATGGVQEDARVPEEIAAALARDVVRPAARPAQPPFWWEPAPCGLAGVRFRSHDEARDIVYPRGDGAARALAERIAALAWPVPSAPAWLRELLPGSYGAGSAPRAVPVDESALLRAVRTRLPLAVIAPLPRVHDLECVTDGATLPSALLLSGWQITGLVDARDVLLYRAGVGRIIADGFGTVRFVAR